MQDRMFHVLVIGGMALVGCGGAEASRPTAADAPDPAPAADARAGEEAATVFPQEANGGAYDASVTVQPTPDATVIAPAVEPVDATPVDAADEPPLYFPTEGPPR